MQLLGISDPDPKLKTGYAIDRMMARNNSKDAQITGLFLIFIGGIGLVSPNLFVIIHNITHLDLGTLTLFSIGIVVVGIAFFVVGLKSRNDHG